MRAYVDSEVLIWYLRGHHKALRFLQRLRDSEANELWTGAMQRAKIVFFVKPEEETATLLFLSQFKTAPMDQRGVDAAAALYRRWQPSHGLDMNDAILAATVMQTGGGYFA
jgi:predicted nucleic acid-binding protein